MKRSHANAGDPGLRAVSLPGGTAVARLAAYLDAHGSRAELEETLGVRLPPGIIVAAECTASDGEPARDRLLTVERDSTDDGGLYLTVHAGPSAEGGEVERLVFHGEDDDGREVYAAVPGGPVRGGRAEIALSPKTVANAPIDLADATIMSAQLRLRPDLARLTDRLGAILTSAGVGAEDEAIIGRVRGGPPAELPWAAATGSEPGPVRDRPEHVQQFEGHPGFRARWSRGSEGELYLALEHDDPSREGQAVWFSLVWPGGETAEGYALLRPSSFAPAPSALLILGGVEAPPRGIASFAFLDEPGSEPEDVAALQWSLERAAAPALKQWLREQIQAAQSRDEDEATAC